MNNPTSMTVGQLAKKFGLSRSTLLYYDRIGLLSPSGRSQGNYRVYDEADIDRMTDIDRYRQAGLSLENIARLLDGQASQGAQILARRLDDINDEISRLRGQQTHLAQLLGGAELEGQTRVMSKDGWTQVMRASGMSDDDMRNWHIEFERSRPQLHQDFLESLGISSEEIESIRAWSRSETGKEA